MLCLYYLVGRCQRAITLGSLALLLAAAGAAQGQTPGVGIGTTAPDASAALDVVSSGKGALLPRLTEVARLAMGVGSVPAPAVGLIVYQTDGTAPGFYYATSATTWTRLTDGTTADGQYIQNQTSAAQPASFRISGTGTAGKLGIGTTVPFGSLANTSANVIGSDGQGGNGNSLAWTSGSGGYVGMFYNSNTSAGVGRNGLAVKVAGTDAGSTALDVSTGPAQATAGTVLLRVRANGRVGIGVGSPAYPLEVAGDISSSSLFRIGGAVVAYRTGNNNYLGTGIVPATAPTGSNNTFVGTNDGVNLTTGTNNTTVGLAAGDALTTGSSNTLVGIQAGGSLADGTDNVYIGHDPGRFAVSGNRNVGIGSNALVISNADDNTAVGQSAGSSISTGAFNTLLGSGANLSNSATQHDRATAIGYKARVDQDDAVVLGDPANAAVQVGIGTTQPSQKLDVNGTARLRGLATAGVVTNLANGTLGTATAASLDATTASNGLTRTGSDVALGGTLAQNTTLDQAGSSLTLDAGVETMQQIT